MWPIELSARTQVDNCAGCRQYKDGYILVCVLHVKLFLLPVGILRNQRPCRFFDPREIQALPSQNHDTEIQQYLFYFSSLLVPRLSRINRRFTLIDLFGNQSSQVSSLLPPVRAFIWLSSTLLLLKVTDKVEHFHCPSTFFRGMLLFTTHALALSVYQLLYERKSIRVCTRWGMNPQN